MTDEQWLEMRRREIHARLDAGPTIFDIALPAFLLIGFAGLFAGAALVLLSPLIGAAYLAAWLLA